MQRIGSYGDGNNRTKISPFSSPRQQKVGYNSQLLHSSVSFTPSPSSGIEDSNNSSAASSASAAATEHRLYLARLTLEYQQIVSRYGLCLNHLQEAAEEAENLREENSRLRVANKDLTKRLTLLTELSLRNRYLPSPGFPSLSIVNDFRSLSVRDGDNVRYNGNHHVSGDVSDNSSHTSVIESKRFEQNRGNGERVTLPKSISVRSNGYVKGNPAGGSIPTTAPASIGGPDRLRSASPVKNETQRVFVPGGNKEEDAVEFDVFDQGMLKTELCNKWQETGACPYADHCQFAHGVNELRPIIRHPRYKTEVCRMVLNGDHCPYGHRCHFRHALTEQERFMGSAA